jgi:hypothetical protein
MSLGRPWEEEYRLLLAELEGRWGKKLEGEDYDVMDAARWDATLGFSYPSFAGKSEGRSIGISLSEDVLEIAIFLSLGATLVIRPEGMLERFLKKVRLQWEFQTGNTGFDRRYSIDDARNNKDKMLVQNASFQKTVQEMGPFVRLALSEKNARCAFYVQDESVLKIAFVDQKLSCLWALVNNVIKITHGSSQ